MGISLRTYVGPFLECQRDDIDEERWEHLVCDGRGESGIHEDKFILVPNRDVEGISREMTITPHGGDDIIRVEPEIVTEEKLAFCRMISEILDGLDGANAWYRLSWGVVPKWS